MPLPDLHPIPHTHTYIFIILYLNTNLSLSLYVYCHICTHSYISALRLYMYMYIYICVYIYIERERERAREKQLYVCTISHVVCKSFCYLDTYIWLHIRATYGRTLWEQTVSRGHEPRASFGDTHRRQDGPSIKGSRSIFNVCLTSSFLHITHHNPSKIRTKIDAELFVFG